MSRSFIYLRRLLFGVSFAVVFGFGTAQAFETWPPPPFTPLCMPNDLDQQLQCSDWCSQHYGTAGGCSWENYECTCNR